MDKYQNRYRISSVRLKNWDYGAPGMYFITICCQNRVCYFGRIIADKPEPAASKLSTVNKRNYLINACLQPAEMGEIANREWLKTPLVRPDMNIELGSFIVMPNPFHAILIIGNNAYNTVETTGNTP